MSMRSSVKSLFKYKKLINLYPPFLGAGVRLADVNETGNTYTVEMKLRWYNRNAYGSHFGGSLYSMGDPWYVFIAYEFFGDDYIIWDKSAQISYVSPGRGKVSGVFHIPMDELHRMKIKIDSVGKSTFHFDTDIKDEKGRVVATLIKEIYIRKK